MAGLRIDEIGRWSEIKLEIVRKYAHAYTTIMSRQPQISRYVYIDAFAGAGQHVSRRTGEFVAGSPLNALNLANPFSEYHFIDLDVARVAELEQIAGGKASNVTVHHGDCNQFLEGKIFPRCRYEDFARGLCVLDPYSLAVEWNVLAAAGAMQSVEVFYNFMIMDLNMNVLLHDPDKVRPDQVERFNRVWGDDSWKGILRRRERTLFDDITLDVKESNERVAEAFRIRLKDVAGFRYVPQPVAMKNSVGRVVYYLYFASPNPTGHQIVTEIFDKYRE